MAKVDRVKWELSEGYEQQVRRKMPSWPRSWANFSLLQHLHSYRNAWANLHLLGRPNSLAPFSLQLAALGKQRPRSEIVLQASPGRVKRVKVRFCHRPVYIISGSYTKHTRWRQNDFNVYAYLQPTFARRLCHPAVVGIAQTMLDAHVRIREKEIRGSLEPPGPLPTHLHNVDLYRVF
jgi:hypothetical protein